MTKDYKDIFYKSTDGLTLYARDYGGDDKPLILCLHGLTRNSSDFHNLALELTDSFRIISVDQRGRGLSDYDPNPANYRPDIYCNDMLNLLSHIGDEQVIVVGTSMGGIMSMMMAAVKPDLFNAVIMNDIGPEIDRAGLDRIKGYVGGPSIFETWSDAAKALKAQGPEIFPDYTEQDWLSFAKRTCVDSEEGTISFAYDAAIAAPIKAEDEAAAPPDMWPLFAALQNTPMLLIRGGLSDILSIQTVKAMQRKKPDIVYTEIPNIGHAPMLDEPESLAAIHSFLKDVL